MNTHVFFKSASFAALALAGAMTATLFAPVPARALDCLLDTNNDGNADDNADTDGGADSGGVSTRLACGTNANANSPGATALGGSTTAAAAQAVAVGNSATATGIQSTAIGNLSDATQENATALGFQAQATGVRSIAIGGDGVDVDGLGARALGADAIAIGADAFADGQLSTALGTGAVSLSGGSSSFGSGSLAAGERATALGHLATARAERTVAIGGNADARSAFSTAVGNNAIAEGTGATALGDNANGSTALGANAATTRDNQIRLGGAGTSVSIADIGASDAAQTGQEFFVTIDNNGTLGKGAQSSAALSNMGSQIASLQQGQALIDDQVASLFNLRTLDRKQNQRGIAAAAAMAQAPFPSAPGKTSYTAASGVYRGEVAFSASLSHRLNTGAPVALFAGVSHSGGKDTAARVGVSGEF
jgi:trimeric autotransporter adhesin